MYLNTVGFLVEDLGPDIVWQEGEVNLESRTQHNAVNVGKVFIHKVNSVTFYPL